MKQGSLTIALTLILLFSFLATCEAFLTDVKTLDKVAISKLTAYLIQEIKKRELEIPQIAP